MLANPEIGVTQIAHRLGVSPALYPKDGTLQEGLSLAAGGGSAVSGHLRTWS